MSHFSTVRDLLHQFIDVAAALISTAHLDKAKSTAVNEAHEIISKISELYMFFQTYTSSALVSEIGVALCLY